MKFSQDLFKLMKKHREQNKKEEKECQKIFESLDIFERESYENLLGDEPRVPFYWITAPFKAIFYLGLFSIVMLWAFNIDIIKPLKLIIGTLMSFYWIFMIMFIIEVSLMGRIRTRKKKSLLRTIKNGRKKK